VAKTVTGFHAIEETLKTNTSKGILYLPFANDNRNDKLVLLAKNSKNIEIKRVSKEQLEKLSGNKGHRGALLELNETQKVGKEITVKEFLENLPKDKGALVLVLDGITDVHNLGAVLRSCDQFSVDLVIIPQRRSAQSNETVSRISSGASLHVRTAKVTNIVREIEILQEHGFWVYGADMAGDSLYETKFAQRTLLIVGSEESGLGQLVTKRCDHIVTIPTSGNIDSLNVSVATGILLFEIRRQQNS